MIEYLWYTPVGRVNLKDEFQDFDRAIDKMRETFPQRTQRTNLVPFEKMDNSGYPAWQELRSLVKHHIDKWARIVELGEELTFFNGHFNEHAFCHLNAPHAHPLCKAVAIFYVRALGKGHGDLLLQDPRAGMNWIDVVDDDGRGEGSCRVFKRYTPVTGDLFIIPAYVVHSVEPNMLRDSPSRMSIGINLFSREFLRHFNPRL